MLTDSAEDEAEGWLVQADRNCRFSSLCCSANVFALSFALLLSLEMHFPRRLRESWLDSFTSSEPEVISTGIKAGSVA